MRRIRFTLLTEGGSDQSLIPALEWLMDNNILSVIPSGKWADLSVLPHPPKTLPERMQKAVELYPCELLCVHRDADREVRAKRCDEIHSAAMKAHLSQVVCVIPVRMTESWMLFDEKAIRCAAGNPNGRTDIGLPPVTALEELPDPKVVLHHALRIASGRKGRRLDSFKVAKCVHLIYNYVSDFSILRQLPAFRDLENEIRSLKLSEASS